MLPKVALITVIWLLTRKAPSVAPPIMAISQGSALRMGPMLPPCAMNTPKTQPSTMTQPMMTNMSGVLRRGCLRGQGVRKLAGVIGAAAVRLSAN
jgi:hypothetical protein